MLDELKQSDEQNKVYEKTQRVKAQKVKDMISGEGFKVIQRDLVNESKRLTTDLLNCTEVSKVWQLQAEIKAIQKFFDKIAFYATIKS